MLIICHGLKEEDFQVEFIDHKIFIGRDKSNSIIIDADGISRFHAVLIEEDNELFIKDNDSLNGTFLNYNQVRDRQRLTNGDIIQIGYRLIRVFFLLEQNMVVLDFVPPEQTENVPGDPVAPQPASSGIRQTIIAEDGIERIVSTSEPMVSSSSSQEIAPETPDMMERTFPPEVSPWRVIHDKWFVLSSVFIICALCILFFFLGKHFAKPDLVEVKRYDGDPLLVTTDQDILDPNDSVNSLREALEYAQNYCLNKTVSFEKDFVIRLTASLAIFNPVSIDGGERDVTIIGPETEPIFRVKDALFTVKNLTLLSDCSGDSAGIMDINLNIGGGSIWDDKIEDISAGLVRVISVKDGGKARTLWRVVSKEGKGLILEKGSHIHRLSAKGSDIRVRAGAVLEEVTLSEGQISVHGTLKNSTLDINTRAYLHEGGLYENLTMKERCSLMTGTGTVNGIRFGLYSSLVYENGCTLSGTISIGWRATTKYENGKRLLVYPKFGTNTNILFNLTELPNENILNSFYVRHGDFPEKNILQLNGDGHHAIPPCDSTIIPKIKGLLGTPSFTIQVSKSQVPGTYLLAGDAAEFKVPVSLRIGDITYSDVLAVGKSFTKDGKVYSLSLTECRIGDFREKDILILTIQ